MVVASRPAGSRSSVGSADLNVLPTAMIDRVEVLRDGASSVYGSDAVAGVVNIQTRKNFEGLIFEAQRNQPVGADGAGGSSRYSLTAGARGDRWRAAGSLERYERSELTLNDREFTRCQTDGRRPTAAGASRDYIDPLTGQSKCYPITGTGSNGSAINSIGVGVEGPLNSAGNRTFIEIAGHRRRRHASWPVQPLPPELGRDHGADGRLRRRWRHGHQQQRARHLRPAHAEPFADLAG